MSHITVRHIFHLFFYVETTSPVFTGTLRKNQTYLITYSVNWQSKKSRAARRLIPYPEPDTKGSEVIYGKSNCEGSPDLELPLQLSYLQHQHRELNTCAPYVLAKATSRRHLCVFGDAKIQGFGRCTMCIVFYVYVRRLS